MAYFRVTVYHPAEDVSAIIDSNGYFEKLWQLSASLVQKGFKILEVGADDRFLEGDLPKLEADSQHLLLRVCKAGRPDYTNGVVQIGGKGYIPERYDNLDHFPLHFLFSRGMIFLRRKVHRVLSKRVCVLLW